MEQDRETNQAFYQPRQPHKTVLHQVLDRHFDDFKSTYDERLERRYGPWRHVWSDVVRKYIDCGIYECGFVVTD